MDIAWYLTFLGKSKIGKMVKNARIKSNYQWLIMHACQNGFWNTR